MLNTRHIIVYAEDDWDDVQFVKDCFHKYDNKIELLHAQNGSEALQALHGLLEKDVKPCLIILDINMPLMDGLKLIARVRADGKHKETPVVVITTEAAPEDRRRALALGANAYLIKPVQAKAVISTVKELLKLP